MNAIDQFRVDGKVALVTGAGRGLGREIALALASGGAKVALTGRDRNKLTETANAIAERFGTPTAIFTGDLDEKAAAQRLVDGVRQQWGGLDILVNNAGINIRGPIEKVSVEDFDRIVATNVRGPWLLCRAAAPIFKAQRSGKVINVASTLGLVALAERTLYCTTKGALVQLTRALAVEWATEGINVNAVCPGPFETEMNQVLMDDPVRYQQFADLTAMRRWGKMDEIGAVTLFLASRASDYVTGAILPIDGGWVAH